MEQAKFSKLIMTLLGTISITLVLSPSSIVVAQDSFTIGAFWVPEDTAYYSQLRDCGMNLIQQPSISVGELVAGERYGFTYGALDSNETRQDNLVFKIMEVNIL